MFISIKIYNVSDETHRKLKAQAALAGQTLSDFLLAEITAIAARPSIDARPNLDEFVARLRSRPPVMSSVDSAAIIREVRDRT